MKHTFPAVLFGAALLFSATPANAQHGGGGHAGSGHFGGFSSHGSGHSLGRIFGGQATSRGKGGSRANGKASAVPRAGEISIHGRMVTLPAPGLHVSAANKSHRPFVEFGFGGPRGISTFSQGFAFGFCSSFGGFPTSHFFGRDFDCFDGGFFPAPFFFGGFIPDAFGMGELDAFPDDSPSSSGANDFENVDSLGHPTSNDDLSLEAPSTARAEAKPKPITLLQLTDGSMYGLTDYWVVDDGLHYVTDYGASNSIPLDRIDLDKTNQLNANRGVKFFIQAESGRR